MLKARSWQTTERAETSSVISRFTAVNSTSKTEVEAIFRSDHDRDIKHTTAVIYSLATVFDWTSQRHHHCDGWAREGRDGGFHHPREDFSIAKMSYSMSPQQQAPPRPYSPYQNAASPSNAAPYGPPPAKRQRTSPDPRSPPNGAPSYAHPPHGMPHANSYGNPYAPPQAQSPYGTPGGYAASPQSAFNTPQAYHNQPVSWQSQPGTPLSAGGPVQYGMRQNSPPQTHSREMMPPPPRPNKEEREDKVGFEDLSDSLFGSGINLKDEENYMYNVYNNRQPESFSTNQNTSFGSSIPSGGNSFNLLTQGTSFGSQDAFAGTMSQSMSQDDIEVAHRRKREEAAKALAERRQHHLNNQFLLGNNLRKRMDRLGREQGVRVNMEGVFVRQPDTAAMVNEDKKEGIVADRVTGVKHDHRPDSLVNQGTAFETIASLVSLAAGERLRGLLGEAYTLSRARQYGDHGRVVPLEFADIAEGEGKKTDATVVPQNVTGSQWDKAPNTGDSATPQPQRTVSFQGSLNAQLRALAERDRDAEAARLKKREARKRAAEAAASGETGALADDVPTTNGAPADTAAPLKMTKKEAAKQAKEKNSSTDAQMHSTTNATAAMMTGLKPRFKWMQGAAANMPTNRFAKPSSGPASGTATPGAPSAGPSAGDATVPSNTGPVAPGSGLPQWGDWSEQSSPGIEIRDWVFVLERDGKERKALELARNKMGREN
ncbi:uncharacterized protein LTR77_008225 [Saxophila tyrrhenica]|uniref:Transcription initiation factor TFIID subunit 4 n=1 Tax=Saxophila tyrrhenica TaxID=1690608 RepID=A0AAV9P2P8_9PEZI|nr:hypothetical protein LTR77_008225 [Saxophila tyrrhenica]